MTLPNIKKNLNTATSTKMINEKARGNANDKK